MYINVVGLSHKTAPIEVREKLSFSEHTIQDVLSELASLKEILEAVIVSTCNRTEIYALTSELEKGQKAITNFLASKCDLSSDKLCKYLYFHQGPHAVHHLFRVASSLDSMVVGEAQILGQIKAAYIFAENAETTDIIFHRLFRQAFTVGKRVRSETAIGESAVSISYAAVELAKKVFDNFDRTTVMILGAGKMSELTAKHLLSQGVHSVLVSNRTYERAVKLAKLFKGEAVKFDDRLERMVSADIIITSTAAPHFVVTKEDIAKVMHKRRNKPIFIIDISVPRDVDPAVNDLYNVFLYDIDDLQTVVEANKEERRKEAERSEFIIEEEIKTFTSWLSALEVTPTISDLKKKAELIKLEELEKTIAKLSDLSEDQKEEVKALATVILNRFLHEPIISLKELTKQKDGYVRVESLRYLFGLDKEKNTK
ncbi:MAG: glutamyl-tRNA reductase [Actinobacteria bacterium]|nr:MAG: glutamyl-tRNA reductase [Actinomycetota bacterium]